MYEQKTLFVKFLKGVPKYKIYLGAIGCLYVYTRLNSPRVVIFSKPFENGLGRKKTIILWGSDSIVRDGRDVIYRIPREEEYKISCYVYPSFWVKIPIITATFIRGQADWYFKYPKKIGKTETKYPGEMV